MTTNNIIYLDKVREWKNSPFNISLDSRRSSEGYSLRVDYNLHNITERGAKYIYKLMEYIYKSNVVSHGKFSNNNFLLRIEEHELKRLNIFDCNALLKKIDLYLQDSILKKTTDYQFFIEIKIKLEKRKKILLKNS